MTIATGTFTIEAWEPEPAVAANGLAIAAVRIEKRFSGDLVGTGTVRMVSGTIAEEPAVYVAIEHIEGMLLGRQGAFLLRHVGTMLQGRPTLDCVVVPGSGTGALTGLAGTLTIDIVDGLHRWELDHTLD